MAATPTTALTALTATMRRHLINDLTAGSGRPTSPGPVRAYLPRNSPRLTRLDSDYLALGAGLTLMTPFWCVAWLGMLLDPLGAVSVIGMAGVVLAFLALIAGAVSDAGNPFARRRARFEVQLDALSAAVLDAYTDAQAEVARARTAEAPGADTLGRALAGCFPTLERLVLEHCALSARRQECTGNPVLHGDLDDLEKVQLPLSEALLDIGATALALARAAHLATPDRAATTQPSCLEVDPRPLLAATDAATTLLQYGAECIRPAA